MMTAEQWKARLDAQQKDLDERMAALEHERAEISRLTAQMMANVALGSFYVGDPLLRGSEEPLAPRLTHAERGRQHAKRRAEEVARIRVRFAQLKDMVQYDEWTPWAFNRPHPVFSFS